MADRVLDGFKRDFQRANEKYGERVRRYEEQDKAYDGMIQSPNQQAKSTKWRSAYHPPYVLQIIETIESVIVDGDPRFRVEATDEECLDSAKVFERLLRWQMCKDHFAEKQTTFVKQALIRGTTAAKVAWVRETRPTYRRTFKPVMGGHPVEGAPETKMTVFKEQPAFIPCDMKDIWWAPDATSIDDTAYVFWRSFSTLESLRAQGIYNNLEQVQPLTGAPVNRGASDLPGPDYRNRVEVIERWTPYRLTVVANQNTVIRDCPNPFWHGKIPFVFASTLPQPFRFDGKSEVELLSDLQTMLWQFQNQRIDNTELINNAIVLINAGVDDPERFEYYPGAQWLVRNPQEVVMWQPNVSILSASMTTETAIKNDLEQIAASMPYLSGSSPDTTAQQTATAASTISSMAQRRVMRKKQQIQFAYTQAGEMQIQLNKQLLPGPMRIKVDEDDAVKWETITPQQIQGDYEFKMEDVTESMNRQERRAEALAKAQFFLSNQPIFAQTGVKIDYRAVVSDVVQAFDDDPEKYLGGDADDPQMPQMPPQQPPQQPPAGIPGPPPQAMGGGMEAATPPPGAVAPSPASPLVAANGVPPVG